MAVDGWLEKLLRKLTVLALLRYLVRHALPRFVQKALLRALFQLLKFLFDQLQLSATTQKRLLPTLSSDELQETAQTMDTIVPQPPKFSRNSKIEMTEVLLPNQADSQGVAFSGVIMSWIDICAGIAAKTHTEQPCVTASVDAIHFLNPIFVGDVVIVKAAVNKAWRTSMEIGVRVEAEHLHTGEKRYCCHDGRPCMVRQLVPETVAEKSWYEDAERRRQDRMKRKRVLDATRKQDSGDILPDLQYVPNAAFQFPSIGQLQISESNHGDNSFPAINSYTQNVQLVMPQHANSLGVTFGGHIIKMMEHCGLVAAMRHARQATFGMNPNILFRTASIDSLSFLSPVRIGDIITVRAYVSRVWTTSLEVYITVHTHSLNYNHYDDLNKGNIANKSEWKFSNDGYMTFIAVEDGMEDRVGSLSPGASHRTFQFQQNKWSLPDVFPVAPEEIERYDAAVDRRSRRLKERQELKNRLVDQIN